MDGGVADSAAAVQHNALVYALPIAPDVNVHISDLSVYLSSYNTCTSSSLVEN